MLRVHAAACKERSQGDIVVIIIETKLEAYYFIYADQ